MAIILYGRVLGISSKTDPLADPHILFDDQARGLCEITDQELCEFVETHDYCGQMTTFHIEDESQIRHILNLPQPVQP